MTPFDFKCIIIDIQEHFMSSDTAVKSRDLVLSKIKEPSKYKVIFVNDNYTPMEFVIAILMSIFKHDQRSAEKITLKIHNDGSGIAGIYRYELAEQRAVEASLAAKANGHPLVVKVEEE